VSSNDPVKAAYLKYLIAWVRDSRADGQLLSDAMSHMPTVPRLTASLPQVDFPDPPPLPELSPSPEDWEWCHMYFYVFAYNNYAVARGILHVGADPNGSDIARSLGFDDVNSLDATNEWMRLIGGLFKSMVLFYPIAQLPGPLPPQPQPDPSDNEANFWRELKEELRLQAESIVTFVNSRFSNKALGIPQPGSAAVPSKSQCILSLERSAHQVFMDYCRIANHLPDHFPQSRLAFGGRKFTK
jgi:hypothetical protein